jgi:hypothetical protein
MLVLSLQIYSQRLSFNVVADPGISWMKTNQKEIHRDGYAFGYNIGLVMDRFFTDHYALSTGISILNTGGSLQYFDSLDLDFGSGRDTLPGESSVRYRLRYLTIPFSIKLHSMEIGYTTMFAHLGINNHIRIRATAEVSPLDIKGENIKNEINMFTMSYFIGGGVAFSFGGDFAILAGAYLTGAFLDVTKNNDYQAYFNMISLRLGVKF